LPVRTADEANAVVAKLVHRASTPPASSVVELIADLPGTDVPFEKGADQLAALVPAPLTTDRINFASTPDSSAAIINAFGRGPLVLNYLGHGSTEIWSDYVFDSTRAAALTNGDKLPFVITMDCLNGYFQDPWLESVGEALLKNPNGGAIGAWASSALSSPD